MQKITIVQIGTKVAKKSDQYRTVFLKDSTHSLFETSTGLGMDLSSKLAEIWFVEVVSIHQAAMEKIHALIADKSAQHHAIALDLELDETGKKFKRGLALSFDTLARYLRLVGLIDYQTQILVDHKDCERGGIYAIQFKF